MTKPKPKPHEIGTPLQRVSETVAGSRKSWGILAHMQKSAIPSDAVVRVNLADLEAVLAMVPETGTEKP